MKLSKDTRREPTQTKTLQNDYVKALTVLFKNYKVKALEAFEQHKGARLMQIEPTDIDIIRLSELLRELGLVYIIAPGKEITADFVRKGYTAGTMYAVVALQRVGVEAVIGEGPADWRVIDSLKVRNLSALRGITDEMNKQIISELTEGINRGESIPKLAERIAEKVKEIGIVRATVMARTETITAFTQGTIIRYQQAGIEKAEWLTAKDMRLCAQCLALDGKIFRLDSNHEIPPRHPMCRCALLPFL